MNKDNKPVMPPAKVECPKCDGSGTNFSFNEILWDEDCKRCHGTGEVYNYLTPEQFAIWMRQNGYPMWTPPGSTAVWKLRRNARYVLETYIANCLEEAPIVIARPDQPAPPNDWRPE